jgi:uncharacterized protein YqfB (UPF0267 family)
MEFFGEVVNGFVTRLTTEDFSGSTIITVDDISETIYKPSYDKILVAGKLTDTINTDEEFKITSIAAKSIKVEAILGLVVTTTSGKIFDGDEKSQDRMARAINIATITGLTETQWKLANNEIVMVTLDELKEALALAGQEMSRIWLEQ